MSGVYQFNGLSVFLPMTDLMLFVGRCCTDEGGIENNHIPRRDAILKIHVTHRKRTDIYIYIYMCVCVCVCVCEKGAHELKAVQQKRACHSP